MSDSAREAAREARQRYPQNNAIYNAAHNGFVEGAVWGVRYGEGGRCHFVSADAHDPGNGEATACGALPLAEPSSDLERVDCPACLRKLARYAEGEYERLREAAQGLLDDVRTHDGKPTVTRPPVDALAAALSRPAVVAEQGEGERTITRARGGWTKPTAAPDPARRPPGLPPRGGENERELQQLRDGLRELGFYVGRNPDGVDDTVAATLLIVREFRGENERLRELLGQVMDSLYGIVNRWGHTSSTALGEVADVAFRLRAALSRPAAVAEQGERGCEVHGQPDCEECFLAACEGREPRPYGPVPVQQEDKG